LKIIHLPIRSAGADLGDGQDEVTVPRANGGDYADWTIALSGAERLRHLAGLFNEG